MSKNPKPPFSGRVVDMRKFLELRGTVGARVLAKALGIPVSSAQKLEKGAHWQQNPDQVRRFNELRGSNIDPDSGVPTNDDLVRYGGIIDRPNRYSSPLEKDVRAVLIQAGVRAADVADVMARITALNGGEVEAPGPLDSATLLRLLETRLHTALRLMSADVMARAGLRDLSTAVSMIIEKRNLLKGEPTAILSHDQRADLATVARRLVEEMKRRGLSIEGYVAIDYVGKLGEGQ